MTEWTPGLKKTRTTVWLNVNGQKNTLRGHMIAHGFRSGYGCTIAKRHDCMQCEVPLKAWRELFGKNCNFCKRPANWQRIIYKDERGSQKNRELGLTINYPEREKEVIVLGGKVFEFLTMPTVVRNPVQCFYY